MIQEMNKAGLIFKDVELQYPITLLKLNETKNPNKNETKKNTICITSSLR